MASSAREHAHTSYGKRLPAHVLPGLMPPAWPGAVVVASLRARYRRSRERQRAGVAGAGVEDRAGECRSWPRAGRETEENRLCAGDGPRLGVTAGGDVGAWELKAVDATPSRDVVCPQAHQPPALPAEHSFAAAATAGSTLTQSTTSLHRAQAPSGPEKPSTPPRRPRMPTLCGLLPALAPERSFETAATAGTYRPRGRRIPQRASAGSLAGATAGSHPQLRELAAAQEEAGRAGADWRGERTPVGRVFGTPASPPPVRRKVPGVGIRIGGVGDGPG